MGQWVLGPGRPGRLGVVVKAIRGQKRSVDIYHRRAGAGGGARGLGQGGGGGRGMGPALRRRLGGA